MTDIEADYESKFLSFLQTFSSMIFCLIIGFIADKYVLHSKMGILGPIISILALILFIWINPLAPSLIISFGFSLYYTATWSNNSFCVNPNNAVNSNCLISFIS